MRKNKGFSYVELLIVISIIAVMAAMAVITMSLVNRNSVTKAATKLESAFNKAKTVSMAQGTEKGKLTIFKENNAYYYTIGDKDTVEKNKICTGRVQLVVSVSGGNSEITEVVYKYKPATGGFLSCPSSQIEVTNGGTSKRLVLYSLTGKVENK